MDEIPDYMRITGIVLIVIGILMVFYTGIDFREKKNVAKIGPIEINRQEEKHVGWPVWSGVLIAVAGIGFLFLGRKK